MTTIQKMQVLLVQRNLKVILLRKQVLAKRLKNGNRGWATVKPAPAPKVQDVGLEDRPHDG